MSSECFTVEAILETIMSCNYQLWLLGQNHSAWSQEERVKIADGPNWNNQPRLSWVAEHRSQDNPGLIVFCFLLTCFALTVPELLNISHTLIFYTPQSIGIRLFLFREAVCHSPRKNTGFRARRVDLGSSIGSQLNFLICRI